VLLGGFVLDDNPMLEKKAIFGAKNVSPNPVHRSGEASFKDQGLILLLQVSPIVSSSWIFDPPSSGPELADSFY
jgi:hypothetical protein